MWAIFTELVSAEDDDNENNLDRVFHCQQRTCPVGKILMKNPDFQHSAKGCPKLANDLFAGLGGGGGGPMPMKDCIEHEICYQTCGKSSEECDNLWNDAQKRHCGGNNQMCRLGVMLAGNLRVPEQNISECDVYEKGQLEGCMCVKEEEREAHMLKAVKAFYLQSPKLTKEKLDENKAIPKEQAEEIKKKWKDKEPELFLRLAMKYYRNNKVIKRIEKPDPTKGYGKDFRDHLRDAKGKKDDDDDDDDDEKEKLEL